MIRTATKTEIQALQAKAFAEGREDALKGESRSIYPANSIGARSYQNGQLAGKQHRAFLDARGMKWIQQVIERNPLGGWQWSVTIEGTRVASGCAQSQKRASIAAEDAALTNQGADSHG